MVEEAGEYTFLPTPLAPIPNHLKQIELFWINAGYVGAFCGSFQVFRVKVESSDFQKNVA